MPSARYYLRQWFRGFDQACRSRTWPYNDPPTHFGIGRSSTGKFSFGKACRGSKFATVQQDGNFQWTAITRSSVATGNTGSHVKGKIVHEAMGRTENKGFSRVRELMWKDTTAPEFAKVVEQETDRRNMTWGMHFPWWLPWSHSVIKVPWSTRVNGYVFTKSCEKANGPLGRDLRVLCMNMDILMGIWDNVSNKKKKSIEYQTISKLHSNSAVTQVFASH